MAFLLSLVLFSDYVYDPINMLGLIIGFSGGLLYAYFQVSARFVCTAFCFSLCLVLCVSVCVCVFVVRCFRMLTSAIGFSNRLTSTWRPQMSSKLTNVKTNADDQKDGANVTPGSPGKMLQDAPHRDGNTSHRGAAAV